jgi:hypothetical protein
MISTRTDEGAELPELKYDELPGLEDVYLEDSFVREIVETDTYTSFTLMAALRPGHPSYGEPAPKEQHRYRMAALTFSEIRSRTWHARTMERFTDADTAVDYGNIDRFTVDSHGVYRLEGEWGSVEIRSDPPELLVLCAETHERGVLRSAYEAWMSGKLGGARHDTHGSS